jgi:hypothetical protein
VDIALTYPLRILRRHVHDRQWKGQLAHGSNTHLAIRDGRNHLLVTYYPGIFISMRWYVS